MRTRVAVLCLLLAGCAALPACAVDTSAVEIRLDRALLSWSASRGTAVTYDGVPVLAPNPGELVVHTRDWQQALYRGNSGASRAVLSRRGRRQVLTVYPPQGGFEGTQTITAGPGDRLRIHWRYRQNAWDDVALQLGLPQLTEPLLVGASFSGRTATGPFGGAIPEAAPTKTTNPFTGALEVRFSSLAATLQVKTSKPVTLYDYPSRGAFFLGLDEPLPRDKWMEFEAELSFSPAAVQREGLVLGPLQMPARIEDGTLRASLRLATQTRQTRTARVALVCTDPDGKTVSADETLPVSRRGSVAAPTRPVARAGRYRCRVVVTLPPDEKEVLRSPEYTMEVIPLLGVLPDRSFYTTEGRGSLLVRTSSGLAGRPLSLVAEGENLRVQGAALPGGRTTLPFDVTALPMGRTEVTCRLLEGERELWRAVTHLTRLVPRSNEVKIDYAGRGLIVDGLPFLPFGFYCWAPPGDLPTQEATQGFVHIAPYQREMPVEQMREYLDRCAAVGLKVHFDIRPIAQQRPSPEKWQRLREWVDAVKEHPALLAYYLCDEPDGQNIPAERLEEAYRFVKELDPYHPITIVLMGTGPAKEYQGAMDILMHDPYPIPSRPVTVVAQATDQLQAAVEGAMPIWIVPQAFGGGEWWQREPSAQEERVMTYLALIHGATGIQFFIRRPPIG
ncbi:MAG: hypothetical protein QHJ73_06900, partial [Armatimonadota bacterium]|nr:hypothetical protein [Armatimonadota bacterium]